MRDTRTIYICDSCRSELEDEPVPTLAGWQGRVYSLDLCEECQNSIETQFGRIADIGAEVGRMPATGKGLPKRRTGQNGNGHAPVNRRPVASSDIREWALKNGYEVSAKGRIPAEVMTAFREAHRQPRRR